jgi:hypothetical protein
MTTKRLDDIRSARWQLNHNLFMWQRARKELSLVNTLRLPTGDTMRRLALYRNRVLDAAIKLRQMLPPRTDK